MEDCGGVTIKFPTAESKSDKVKEKKDDHFFIKFEFVVIYIIYVYRSVSEDQRTM